MTQHFYVKIDSIALGKKFVSKDATFAQQRYTNLERDALRVGQFKDANELAKNWAERTGNHYVVNDGKRDLARFDRSGKVQFSSRRLSGLS